MGEPITVYDRNGSPMTVHGRAYADALIAAGEATERPPAAPRPAAVEAQEPKPRPKGKGK